MPVFVVSMEHSYTHSFKYCLQPTKPKYLLLDLYSESLPTPDLYIPLANFNYHSQCLPNSHSVPLITCIITVFFPTANQSASDPCVGLCYCSFNVLGSVSSSYQQCFTQYPLDLHSVNCSTDCDTRFMVNSLLNLLLAVNAKLNT